VWCRRRGRPGPQPQLASVAGTDQLHLAHVEAELAQIKDEKMYQDLRGEGASKEKAARIANAAAAASRSQVGRKGGKSGSYDNWTKPDLLWRARKIGIKGRSTVTKAELIKALRNH
jgi:hypothetical protein